MKPEPLHEPGRPERRPGFVFRVAREGRVVRPGVRFAWLPTLILGALVASSGSAVASDPWESWPEVSAFVSLNPQSRLYLDAAYAQGKESLNQALDAAAYLDLSLKPILRPSLMEQEDWARARYLWSRIGYDHVFKGEGGVPTTPEDRGILSIYGKGPLPGEIWLELRTRADLRWIGGDYSTRYRVRGEATREFVVRRHAVVPYANVEWFYDTRYRGISRALVMGGAEFTVSKGFRFETYLARQQDQLPNETALNALGLVAKWYF